MVSIAHRCAIPDLPYTYPWTTHHAIDSVRDRQAHKYSHKNQHGENGDEISGERPDSVWVAEHVRVTPPYAPMGPSPETRHAHT